MSAPAKARDPRMGLRTSATLATVFTILALFAATWVPVFGPLVHLVRNALDHGIEPPATRVARRLSQCERVAQSLEPVVT